MYKRQADYFGAGEWRLAVSKRKVSDICTGCALCVFIYHICCAFGPDGVDLAVCRGDDVLDVYKRQVSIRGSKSVGTILEATEAAWNEGDTAFSVLKNITRAQGIPMEFSGSGASVYVEGIANLYEFDEGATSGWVYRVNGTLVSKSAGACVLHPGDRIEWIYTLNLGKDLN